MPFDDDEADLGVNPKQRPALKIGNQQSSVPSKAKPNTADFDREAKAAFEKTEEYKQRAFELGKQFKKIVQDKTLPLNKGKIGQEIESETLSSIINLGVEMNVDETQQEGMGSMGVCALLLKGLVMQRDRINALEHALSEAQKAINVLTSRVEQVDKDK